MAKHKLFLLGGLFFIFGVFLESKEASLLLFLLCVFSLIFLARVFFGKLSLILVFSLMCVFVLGYVYSDYRQTVYESLVIPYNEPVRVEGAVVSDPYVKNGVQIFVIKTLEEKPRRIWIAARYKELLTYGDRVRIYGYAEDLSSSSFSDFLRKENIHASVSFPRVVFVQSSENFLLKKVLYDFRREVTHILGKIFIQDEAALASGVLLGNSRGFSKEMEVMFRESGVSHIVALSGFNVTVLVIFTFGLCLFFVKRRVAFFLALIITLFFTLAAGAPASLVRAMIMSFLVLAAREFGRFKSDENIFVLSALLMIIYEPSILVFDLGFQLSFAAVLGIYYMQPLLMSFLPQAGVFGLILNILMATFSAELAVAPILLGAFSSVSLVGLVTNILILPFIPILMFFASVAVFVFYAIPFLLNVFSFPAHLILSHVLYVAEKGAEHNPSVDEVYLWFWTGFLFLLVSGLFLFRTEKNAKAEPDGFFSQNAVE